MYNGYTHLSPTRQGDASRRRRQTTKALALAIALTAVLAGCSSGPGEDQMLPEKDLVFPGATTLSKRFEEEYHGRKLDGPRVDAPAILYTEFRAEQGTRFDDVMTWYRQQLEPKGWEAITSPHNKNDIEFVRTTDGHDHEMRVYVPGSSDERYSVAYEIREHP